MKKKVLLGILVIFLIAFVPLFVLKDAEFGGSDDAGSTVGGGSGLLLPAVGDACS